VLAAWFSLEWANQLRGNSAAVKATGLRPHSGTIDLAIQIRRIKSDAVGLNFGTCQRLWVVQLSGRLRPYTTSAQLKAMAVVTQPAYFHPGREKKRSVELTTTWLNYPLRG